jgi:hypothetical protein
MANPPINTDSIRWCARLSLTHGDADLLGHQLHGILGYSELVDAVDGNDGKERLAMGKWAYQSNRPASCSVGLPVIVIQPTPLGTAL